MEQFWVIFWSAIGTLVTGLITWLTTYLIGLLNRKIKDDDLRRWSTQVLQIVMSAVQAVSQEFVETLKKNGKFDAKAQKEAKERAYKIIMGQLTEDLKKYITDNFGDMQEWIYNQIETCLYQLKN